ncbi:MAG: globin [Sulfurimonas sp.]|jgi:hemoglobin|nr:globin [Sulfurimonas sp.]MBU1218116.1 globin [bacterium]MBU1434721.1 globin [bacterium]MBU1502709.1 globin [bacterium]MBU3940170.1 globin [bacterium]
MKLTITDGQIGVRPPVAKPHPGFFYEVGEERFKKLVYDHYDAIEESDIAFLFPVNDEEDFAEAKKHAFDFLVEISGGPDYFTQTRGAHQMVGRHAPFRIDEASRKSWLSLYIPLLEALVDEGITPEYIESFWNYLDIFSMWLVNTES